MKHTLNQKDYNGSSEPSAKRRLRTATIKHGIQNFLILDSPSDKNIDSYIEVLKKKEVTIVVRACESTYKSQPIIDAGIRFMELPFADGEPPPNDVIDKWLTLCSEEFGKDKDKKKTPTVGVHCVAGLGRAPILVAIALVESGLDAVEAIDTIRKHRKGAFNTRQLAWIEKYKRRRTGCNPACTIS